jgi:hypothetical protein
MHSPHRALDLALADWAVPALENNAKLCTIVQAAARM